MASTYKQYAADGANRNFAVPFAFIDRSYVHVYVDGVETTAFVWINDGMIQLTTAPAGGSIVEVRRITPTGVMPVDFEDGSILSEDQLDAVTKFSAHLSEEARDFSEDAPRPSPLNDAFDIRSKRLKNVAAGVDPTDAVNKGQLDSLLPTFVSLEASATSSKNAAATSAAGASTSADAALAYLQAYRATSYGALNGDPVVDPNGNPPTVGDEYFDTASNLLKRFNGATWQASDINTGNLAASTGAGLIGFITSGIGAVARTLLAWMRDRPVSVKDFGATGNGVTDDTAAIQAAIDTVAADPFGGTLYLPRGTYALSAAIVLGRGVKLQGAGKSATVLKLTGNHAGITQQILSGGVGALNVSVFDLKIQGTDNPAHSSQHGIVCASTLQYSTFERILIEKVGGNGIDASVTPLGAIFNSFRDIEITYHRGYGMYICGNYGQTIHERVRSMYGYSHGFVIDGTNNSGSNPLSNTFVGCACESTSNTTGDIFGVYFLSNSLYNAYDTTFLNCYMEPKGRVTGDSCGYSIGAAKGVKIIGGSVQFCHWGVRLTSQFAEGVSIDRMSFIQSPTWGGTANLAGKTMLDVGVAGATLHVGPQCSAQLTGGITWDTLSAASTGRVWGYLDFQNKLYAGKRLTMTPAAGPVANRPAASSARRGELWFTESAAGFADHAEVCVKRADDSYVWVSVGGQWDYKDTFTFAGVGVAAGQTQSQLVGATGAGLGRLLFVAPDASLGGLIMTATAEGASQIRLTFYNPTGATIAIPAGTWTYGAQT